MYKREEFLRNLEIQRKYTPVVVRKPSPATTVRGLLRGRVRRRKRAMMDLARVDEEGAEKKFEDDEGDEDDDGAEVEQEQANPLALDEIEAIARSEFCRDWGGGDGNSSTDQDSRSRGSSSPAPLPSPSPCLNREQFMQCFFQICGSSTHPCIHPYIHPYIRPYSPPYIHRCSSCSSRQYFCFVRVRAV